MAVLTLLAGSNTFAQAPTSLIAYDVDAVLDMKARVIDARARITVPARALASPTEVLLDVGGGGRDAQGRPRLSLLQVRGGALAPGLRDGSLAVITLPAAVVDAARLEVSWRFHLDPEVRAVMGYDWLPANDPESLWYPDIVGASGQRERFHDFKVALTHPSAVTAQTSGVLESGTGSSNSRRDVYLANHAEGFALNLGEGYVLTEVRRPEIRITAFSPREEQQTFREAAEMTATAVEWYRKTYGFFPLSQMGIAPGHPKYKGGFPATHLFYIHGGDRSSAYLKGLIAHELGHYYWGLYVRSASWEQLDWLMLANGIWADQLFQAESAGRALDDQWRGNDWMVRFLAAGLAGRELRLDIPASEEAGLGFDYNTAVRHAKGAVGLWLQARRLGTARFLELQRRLLTEYRDRPLPVGEFAKRLEAEGAPGAEEFFRAFARGDATFAFDVSSVETERAGNGWSYKITVSRRGTLRYPIAIEVLSQTGERVRRDLSGNEPKETVAVTLAAPLAEVRLDPDGILPMWNSAHFEIRRAYLLALDRAGLTEAFLAWGSDSLRIHPQDDVLRARLAERMLQVGRCQAVIDLLSARVEAPYDSATSCRSALFLSTARTRCGQLTGASELLGAIKDGCSRAGLVADWERARQEAARQPVSR